MRRDTQRRAELKATYRIKNWKQYNAGLIARGDITMWIDQGMLASPEVGVSKRGRPCLYPDAVIQMRLGLKQVLRLPLRALQGFAMSLRKWAFAELPVPNYSTLSRRAQDLSVVLPAVRSCCIPADCIDKNRYPLFLARDVLRELVQSLQSTGSL